MTQPVQEPTTQRSISRLRWESNQLFRRPSPPSAFVPTLIRGRQTNGHFQSISSGVEIRLLFDTWENGDDSVFTPSLVGSDLESVICQEDGIYSIQFSVSIQTLTSTAQLVLIMNDNHDSPSQIVMPAEIAGSGGDYIYSDMRTYPPFQGGGGGDADISFDIAHNHGSARNTQFGTAFEIVYFGPYRSELTS